MPVTRSTRDASRAEFLSLSNVKKSKPVKRTIDIADDSINVAKKQKRCKLRQNRKNAEINVNNVSITSDHNDDLEMREIATAIAENVDGVDIGPKDGEEVLATENFGNSQADGEE